MGMNMHDRYYEPEDDGYPDDWEWKVEQYKEELLMNEYNYNTQGNWLEGVSECGYDEELYPTPTHAPMEVVERVSLYWYNLALAKSTDYYEENPYND